MAPAARNGLEEVLAGSYKALTFLYDAPGQEYKIAARALEKNDIAYSVIECADGAQPKDLVYPFLELYGDTKDGNEPITLDSNAVGKKWIGDSVKYVGMLFVPYMASTIALDMIYPHFFRDPYISAASALFVLSGFATDAYTSTKFKNIDGFYESNPIAGDESGNFRLSHVLKPSQLIAGVSCVISSLAVPTLGFVIGTFKHYVAMQNHNLLKENIKNEVGFLESFAGEKMRLLKELYEES